MEPVKQGISKSPRDDQSFGNLPNWGDADSMANDALPEDV
jgi:hypothetical protein